ncbi:MAG: hypothetical protein WBY88_04890 [Desulfosarcina sp.]
MKPPMQSMEKWAATHHLPFTLDGHPACPRVPEALDSLVAAMPRGQIVRGIAIPHPRDPLSQPPMSPVIVTCFPESPLNFNAIDDKPVFVFFILISPSVEHHPATPRKIA